jgi:hypothetical protein
MKLILPNKLNKGKTTKLQFLLLLFILIPLSTFFAFFSYICRAGSLNYFYHSLLISFCFSLFPYSYSIYFYSFSLVCVPSNWLMFLFSTEQTWNSFSFAFDRVYVSMNWMNGILYLWSLSFSLYAYINIFLRRLLIFRNQKFLCLYCSCVCMVLLWIYILFLH